MMQHALRHSRAGEGRNICHSCFEQTSQVVGIYLKYSGYIFGIGSDNITLSNRSNMENFIQKIIFLEETTTYCFFQPCRLMFCLFGTFNQPSNLIVPCSDRTESSPSSFSIDETLAVSELMFLSPSLSSRVPFATSALLDSLLLIAPVEKEIIFYLFKSAADALFLFFPLDERSFRFMISANLLTACCFNSCSVFNLLLSFSISSTLDCALPSCSCNSLYRLLKSSFSFRLLRLYTLALSWFFLSLNPPQSPRLWIWPELRCHRAPRITVADGQESYVLLLILVAILFSHPTLRATLVSLPSTEQPLQLIVAREHEVCRLQKFAGLIQFAERFFSVAPVQLGPAELWLSPSLACVHPLISAIVAVSVYNRQTALMSAVLFLAQLLSPTQKLFQLVVCCPESPSPLSHGCVLTRDVKWKDESLIRPSIMTLAISNYVPWKAGPSSNFLLQVITLRLQLSSGNLQLVRHLLGGLTRYGDFCRLFAQSRNRFCFSLQFALHLFDLFFQRRHSLGCLL
ncbi:hypothetical protein ALC53_03954 [Atta colombica]|uniref:Uncharacterized protein n=1 Tax=Atta colombica TaxID=520822 RepID=A0A195BMT4_9HYME|nr:hypothetical protein ALC53_03954 [Atta colombica]